MKKLKLSTVATAICLLCMSMGFPNLEEEGKEKDKCSKKKSRTTDVRTVALMSCSRQVSLAEKVEQTPAGATCAVKTTGEVTPNI
jgi:hypothetical protein